MGKTKDKSLNELLNRSTAEKILAVEKLWDNIKETAANDEPSQYEKTFIKERVESYVKNPTKIKKWEEVKADYLKKK